MEDWGIPMEGKAGRVWKVRKERGGPRRIGQKSGINRGNSVDCISGVQGE